MVGSKKVWAGILILALVVAGAGVAYAQWGGSDSGKKKDLIILSDVERTYVIVHTDNPGRI